MRQVVFEAMASGFSIEEIAEMRKVSPRTIRREVDRTLDERRLDAPERYVHFQVARLTKVVRVADAGLDRGELRAIGPMIKAVKELDRYHGLRAYSHAALPAPRAARVERLPPSPRRLAPAAAPLARRPRKSGGPEAAAATPQTERLNQDARFRGHSALACDAEASPCANARDAHESDFVTDSAAQTLEIMGRLPELQPARDDSGAPSACCPRESGGPEPAAATLPAQRLNLDACVRGHDTASPVLREASSASAPALDKSAFMTDSAAQALEITQSLPRLRPASEERGEGPEAGVGAADQHGDPRVLPGPSGAGGRDAAEPGDRDVTPEPAARLYDRWVGHEEWARGRNPWRSRSTVSTDRIHA
jgi:hypothetical protein